MGQLVRGASHRWGPVTDSMTDSKVSRLLELANRTTFPAEAEAARAAAAKLVAQHHDSTQPRLPTTTKPRLRASAPPRLRTTTKPRRYGITLL